jgi:dTDP-4-dehydrorhamnose reductase
MNILVIGGTGLVGSNVVDTAKNRGHSVTATYHSTESTHTEIELDKTDEDRTRRVIEDIDPDLVVDTAAFHAVDDCETKRDKAWKVNAQGTRNVAAATNTVDAHLVYLSTDYVFPGNPNETPYTESDPVNPANYYGETKYAAEQSARIADSVTILRPSVVYGLASDNFVTWVLGELKDGNEVNIVDDQTSTPTFAPDLAKACLDVGEQAITGLYHATGPESVSRYEFTLTLAEVYELETELIEPITTEELGQEADRPEDSTLDSSYLYEAIDYEFRRPEAVFQEMRTAANETN